MTAPTRPTGLLGQRRPDRLGPPAWVPYALVAPSVLVLLAMTLYPLYFALTNSFKFWNLQTSAEPAMNVGFDNYRFVFENTPFVRSLINTLAIAISGTIIEFALGFAIALLLFNRLPGMRPVRALLLMPTTIAPVIVGILFRYLYTRPGGVIDWLAGLVGLAPDKGFLGEDTTALAAVLLVDVWQWTPFFAIILYAALLGVPKDLVEAAKLDGSSLWQLSREVYLPMIKSTAVIIVMLRFMQLFNMFDLVLVLTRGGPGDTTRTLAYTLYQTGLVEFNIGLASAMTWISVLIVNAIVGIYVFFAFRDWEW